MGSIRLKFNSETQKIELLDVRIGMYVVEKGKRLAFLTEEAASDARQKIYADRENKRVAINDAAQSVLEKYPSNWYRNYASRPTIDVPVVALKPRCKDCGEDLSYEESVGAFGGYVHVNGRNDHIGTPTVTCEFCGCNDPALVKFSFGSYSDDVNCARCGGYSGRPTGD